MSRLADDFECWAELSARIRRVAPEQRERWLRSQGMEGWEHADRRWCQAIVDDIARGDLERAMRYSDVCAREGNEPLLVPDDDRQAPHAAAAIAEAPNARPAANDFRAQLMFEPSPPIDEERRAAARLGENFRGRMAPAGPLPAVPAPGQVATAAATDLAALRNAQAALGWPLDTYAKLCAELDIDGDKIELVCAQYGISPEVLGPVHTVWSARLKADPARHREWYEAMQRYRGQFSARRALRER